MWQQIIFYVYHRISTQHKTDRVQETASSRLVTAGAKTSCSSSSSNSCRNETVNQSRFIKKSKRRSCCLLLLATVCFFWFSKFRFVILRWSNRISIFKLETFILGQYNETGGLQRNTLCVFLPSTHNAVQRSKYTHCLTEDLSSTTTTDVCFFSFVPADFLLSIYNNPSKSSPAAIPVRS